MIAVAQQSSKRRFPRSTSHDDDLHARILAAEDRAKLEPDPGSTPSPRRRVVARPSESARSSRRSRGDTTNPFLNYAIPDDGGIASPDDVESLVAAYQARGRKPQLEYIPSVAPAIETGAARSRVRDRRTAPADDLRDACASTHRSGIELVVAVDRGASSAASPRCSAEAYEEREPHVGQRGRRASPHRRHGRRRRARPGCGDRRARWWQVCASRRTTA